jgi:hypothetical protein
MWIYIGFLIVTIIIFALCINTCLVIFVFWNKNSEKEKRGVFWIPLVLHNTINIRTDHLKDMQSDNRTVILVKASQTMKLSCRINDIRHDHCDWWYFGCYEVERKVHRQCYQIFFCPVVCYIPSLMWGQSDGVLYLWKIKGVRPL